MANAKKNAGSQISVRMYNVGFGDAFLVTIPNGKKPMKILFDCGSVEAAAGTTIADVVGAVITDATDSDGVARIDVVVATHRHKDHVSGFASKAWADVEVKEVWMPWTEDPKDPEARRIRNVQAGLARALDAAITAKEQTPGAVVDPDQLKRPKEIAANALMLSNEAAMKTLHDGFAGDPLRRFLPGKDKTQRTLTTPALPGVTVYVMGPSHDKDVIRDMDPPNGQSYLRLAGIQRGPAGAPPPPFPSEPRLANYDSTGTFLLDDPAAIEQATSLSDLAVAVALDKAVNGTSLMLVLQVGATYMLFPGDAQWGTWQAVLEDPEWRDLLAKVDFYKIGHHGSHNATPREFVEKLLPSRVTAMASTLTRAVWPNIPKAELIEALAAKQAVIARSDDEQDAPKAFTVRGATIEARLGAKNV